MANSPDSRAPDARSPDTRALDALRALLPQLTPGPWRGPPTAPADVAFAAAAREAVPRLLEALEHTEALRDELQAQLDALHEAHAALRERHAEMERVLGAELRRARTAERDGPG